MPKAEACLYGELGTYFSLNKAVKLLKRILDKLQTFVHVLNYRVPNCLLNSYCFSRKHLQRVKISTRKWPCILHLPWQEFKNTKQKILFSGRGVTSLLLFAG